MQVDTQQFMYEWQVYLKILYLPSLMFIFNTNRTEEWTSFYSQKEWNDACCIRLSGKGVIYCDDLLIVTIITQGNKTVNVLSLSTFIYVQTIINKEN